ncbi:MAG TPA: tyrosine-protein phosphatase [Kofleriaceae bacterium]|nr:tyrosine-protein phosphatase [Kofleriaceae bacterium]
MIALVAIGGGALALTHRPKKTAFAGLRAAGATHLVTLLDESEGSAEIGTGAIAAGLAWIWLPLRGGNPPRAERDDELRGRLREIADVIRGGGHVVVHCSAGVHRTGMIGYALLRQLGLDAPAARAMLAQLRDVTADGVGDERCAWGDRLAGLSGVE